MKCIHPNIKRYRVKGTDKIRWICEDCGASGISVKKYKKTSPKASNEQKPAYPHIVGEKVQYSGKPLQGQGLPPSKPALTGESIGYRGITENLQSGMQDLNKGIRNMPRLVIGKPNNSNIQQKPLLSEKEQKIVRKLKKWALILAVIAIIGYAGYRIFGVFFGG